MRTRLLTHLGSARRLAGLAAATLAVGVLGPVCASAVPLGSGFSYQGQLMQNGVPVNGTRNLRFSLWDAAGSGTPPVGGAHLGASQLLLNVPVTDGAFTVLLDDAGQFGPTAFTGDARWLQVEVCEDPACATVTTLSPRQPVTATPYALFSAGPWETNNGNTVLPSGSAGIGTVTPEALLHIVNGDLLVGANDEEWMFHTRSHRNGDFLQITDLDGGVPQFQRGLVLTEAGNVGIGTTAPTARLEVRGDAKLGPTGQYWVPGGEEKLRIMRGEILADGSAPSGCCFSCVRIATGTYDITFLNAFAGTPVVTATMKLSTGAGTSTVVLGPGAVRVITTYFGSVANADFQFIAMGPP